MRQGTYLNAILTINAILLAVLAWTQLSASAPLAQPVQAQSASGGGTMVSAADQRQRMIESLRDIQKAVNDTNRKLDRGTLRVHVANASELRKEADNSEQQRSEQ